MVNRECTSPGRLYNVRAAMDEKSMFVCSDGGLESWPLVTNQWGAGNFHRRRPKKFRCRTMRARGPWP